MAGSGEVLLEVDGGVAIVTLNAPDRRNALTPAMAAELIETFDEVDARPEVGALVVRAVGKSFCAGGDIATLTAPARTRRRPTPTRAWARSTTPSTGSARCACPRLRPCAGRPSAPA